MNNQRRSARLRSQSVTPEDPSAGDTDLCRLACRNLSCIYEDYTEPQNQERETDTSWWSSSRNDGRGVRLKRRQMGQIWRLNSGISILESENQTQVYSWC